MLSKYPCAPALRAQSQWWDIGLGFQLMVPGPLNWNHTCLSDIFTHSVGPCSYSGCPLNASSYLVLFCWQMYSKWNVSKSYYFDFLKNHRCLKFHPNNYCLLLPDWIFCIEVLAWIWNRTTTTLWRAERGLPAPFFHLVKFISYPTPRFFSFSIPLAAESHGLSMTLTFVNSCCGSWQLLNYLWWIGWSHLISPKGR